MGKQITMSQWSKLRGAASGSLYKYVHNPEFELFVTKRTDGKITVEYPAIDNYLNSFISDRVSKGTSKRYREKREMEGKEKDIPMDINSVFDDIDDYGDIKKEKLKRAEDLAQARLLKETYAAENERLKFEKAQGVLIDRDLVNKSLFTAIRELRNKILTLPDRYAAEVSGMTDSRSIHILMTDQLVEGLQECVDYLKTHLGATINDIDKK